MALVLVKYGLDNPAESIKLSTANENDKVVLIQNGVYWAILQDVSKLTKARIYVLKNDLEARGYCGTELSDVELIDYEGFIELLEKEEKFIG